MRLIRYKSVAIPGGLRELELHAFAPACVGPTPAPAALLFHGGGWRNGTPERYHPIAEAFAQAGYTAFCASYRLVGKADGCARVLDCVHDARSAMRHLHRHAAELGIDRTAIVAVGGSAGGHLAAATALCDGPGHDDPTDDLAIPCRPLALVLFNPVIDTSAEGYGNALLGADWRDLSPLHRVRPELPPAIVFHGTADRTVPFTGAQRFAEAMLAAGNRCEFHAHPGGGHGYYWEAGLLQPMLDRCFAFLRPIVHRNPA